MSLGRHCAFLLHVHLIVITKYRYGVFTPAILDGLKKYLPRIAGILRLSLSNLMEKTTMPICLSRAAQARAAAQGMGDPCLQQLFQDLGEDAEFHAQRLRALLEEMP